MAETSRRSVDGSTPKALKDKQCPFCQQPFTSSSLGRHLDLYIKEKNPKAADGIHDVDIIRKLRGNITRRQAKASSLSRRGTSASVGTPTAASKRSPGSEYTESPMVKSPVSLKESAPTSEAVGRQFPFNTPWEATGVINDILAARDGEGANAGEGEGASDAAAVPQQRTINRQAMKQQLDARHQLQDALDTARAAELALREVIGSFRAAKLQIDMDSVPFDFDPLALDFPALTIQCLEPPPTLFSSTQHPTSTSWSILPPGSQQYKALQKYFQDEFQKWRITCASAVTAANEDLPYPPPVDAFRPNAKDEIRNAEKRAEVLEAKVFEHMESTYRVWDGLPQAQRENLWILELARSVGRKQKEIDRLNKVQHSLKQENAHIKSQIEHLNRLQQPREFKISPPTTIFVEPEAIDYVQDQLVIRKRGGVGLNLTDRHSDLNTIISNAIDRWKNVVVSTRSTTNGLQGQRPLNPPGTRNPGSGMASSGTTNPSTPQAQAPAFQGQQQVPALQNPPQSQNLPTTNNNASAYASSATPFITASPPSGNSQQQVARVGGAPSTAPSASPDIKEDNDNDEDEDENEDDEEDEDEDMSDQDAEGDEDADADADVDAEMDDYAAMNHAVATTSTAASD
ncbi:hypothetical protein B0T24DRAFT_662566 [Lasiosphaeria ovina]|uniref:Uncharacterized protein n=1 Tax=Lasiosphaeria ovina TaxID=92902 RepID=A0AAE0TYH2_9PEZI|nr:hypothetical protein B0T24DRAFT_662566 [Lasiosphaeria ovina]